MEHTKTSPKIFILSLYGDISMGSGVTLEIGGVSPDRSKLEALKVLKDEELDEYLGDDGITGERLDQEGEWKSYDDLPSEIVNCDSFKEFWSDDTDDRTFRLFMETKDLIIFFDEPEDRVAMIAIYSKSSRKWVTPPDIDGDPEYSYHNNDLSGRPTWDIEEIDLL